MIPLKNCDSLSNVTSTSSRVRLAARCSLRSGDERTVDAAPRSPSLERLERLLDDALPLALEEEKRSVMPCE